MTDFVGYVSKLQAAGFDKVCVVNKSYQVVGASDQASVPSAWNDTDTDKTLINENQELANPWDKITTGKFHFFKKKWAILQKSSNHIVGNCTGQAIVAKEITKCWIVASAKTVSPMSKAKGKGFKGAPKAYDKACSVLFDDLDEDED